MRAVFAIALASSLIWAATAALAGPGARKLHLKLGDVVVTPGWTCAEIHPAGSKLELGCGDPARPSGFFVVMKQGHLTVYRCRSARCSAPDVVVDEAN